MKMYDCDVCQSAGSVNQWGCCEICGEEHEDPGSVLNWSAMNLQPASVTIAPAKTAVLTIGKDAA